MLKNYIIGKDKKSFICEHYRFSLILAAIFFTTNLIAQTPELVSDNAKDPEYLTEFDGELFFSAEAPDSRLWLWSTDGTTTSIRGAGTVLNSHPGSQPRDLTVFNNQLFLSSVVKEGTVWNREFFTYLGITDKLKLIKNIQSGGESYPTGFAEYSGNLYFSADDGTNGRELWITDGTGSGTQLFKNLNAGTGDGNPYNFLEYNGKLLFTAKDNTHAKELWITDGTSTGTKMVKDIGPAGRNGVYSAYTTYNNKVYFVGDDATHGEEPWVTDGTESGTYMLKDINTDSNDRFNSSEPGHFTEYDGKLYFIAKDVTHGRELWTTDGTESGTVLFKETYPGTSDGFPVNFTVYNDLLYFRAYDGNGAGLWVSDGTSTGTVRINFSTDYIGEMFVYDDRLYFLAEVGSNGRQLWVSDGTASGTKIVAPRIAPNANPLAHDFKHSIVDGTLYYTADYDGNGEKLWKLTTNNLSVEDNIKNEFVAYPNPVQDILHLETPANNIQKVELLSITGQRLGSWKGKSEINMSQFAPGSYFVKTTTRDGQIVVKKILKE